MLNDFGVVDTLALHEDSNIVTHPIVSSTGRRLTKILHVIASVDPRGGGPIEGILQQSKIRTSNTITTDIATCDDPAAAHVVTCPLTVYAMGRKPVDLGGYERYLPWVHYRRAPALISWLRANARNYDIVVVNGLWNYATFAASRALAGSSVPYVVFPHGMLDPWFKTAYPWKSRLKQVSWWFCEGPLLNNARAVMFTTEDERLLAQHAFWPYRPKERVVGYGTGDIEGDPASQVAAFRAGVPTLGPRRYLLYLSRIHRKKGCDLLISAFATIADAHPDLDLVIAGPDQTGWQPTLMAQAAKLGVASRIHWPGMLTGDAKWGAFRDCDAFVLPSHQENFGIVVAEAMAAGRPVLISDKVNIWREVTADGAGLAESDTLEGTTRLLGRFLELSNAQRAVMGQAARTSFLDRFEIQNVVEGLLRIFAEEAA